MPKYNVQERLAQLTAQVEDATAGDMINEFKQELHKQFKKRKEILEDWQDLTPARAAQLKNRLQVIAQKPEWSVNNLLDMALIASLLWNEEVNGD
jgi:hypothetical protein